MPGRREDRFEVCTDCIPQFLAFFQSAGNIRCKAYQARGISPLSDEMTLFAGQDGSKPQRA